MRAKGVITVFFTLLSLIFLGLFFILIESVRYQGSRAACAGAAEMGNFSLFGEYEQMLLEEFDLFGLDGAAGTGDFSMGRVSLTLRKYLEENSSPRETAEGPGSFCFDPWSVSLTDCEIGKYALLSDKNGDYFYEQAVRYMRETAVTGLAGKLVGYYRDAMDAKTDQERFEQDKKGSDTNMKDLEETQSNLEKQQEAETDSLDPAAKAEEERQKQERKTKNPLKILLKLATTDILKTVCPGADISGEKTRKGSLYSGRNARRGNLTVHTTASGLLCDLYFREYLLDHFRNYQEPGEPGKLCYEIEYILCGKTSDKANLKATAQKLLLLREGCNYAGCVQDAGMNAEAESLAILLIGWTGMPALVAVMKHTLILGWAYAESLLDVKTLMDGGHVPLVKDSGTWQISLENLVKIREYLNEDRSKQTEGIDYRGHLRLLLNLQGTAQQKKRGLDMIEQRIRAGSGLEEFRVDHCLIALQDEESWRVRPLFSRVTGALLKIAGKETEITVKSGYSYLL